ncbi:MAG TPA: hypothetical protein VNJ08_03950 [Bacteriovoracaceae bacterium]|nr:hypothetical protein [Bacteriovoracaceae bacterium]
MKNSKVIIESIPKYPQVEPKKENNPDPLSERPECLSQEERLSKKSDLEHFKDLIKDEAPDKLDETIEEILELSEGLGLRHDSSPIAKFYVANGHGIYWDTDPEERDLYSLKLMQDLAKGSSNGAYHLHLAISKYLLESEHKEIAVHLEDAMRAPDFEMHESALKRRIFDLGMRSAEKYEIASHLHYSLNLNRHRYELIGTFSELMYEQGKKNKELVKRFNKYSEAILNKTLLNQNDPKEYFPQTQYNLFIMPYHESKLIDYGQIAEKTLLEYPPYDTIPGHDAQTNHLGYPWDSCTPSENNSAWKKRKDFFNL